MSDPLKVLHVMPTELVSESLSVQRVADRLGAEKVRLNVWTLNEGSILRHSHREQEELYVVLDGSGETEVEGVTYALKERDALLVPPGVAHRVINAGVGPLTFLVAAAPAIPADSVICK